MHALARIRPLLAFLAGLMVVAATAAFSPPAPVGAANSVTVMSRNLYLGADLLPVIGSATPAELVANAAAAWQAVQATNFPERAQAIADEVRAQHPDLIGLQEVALWRTQTPFDGPASPATTPAVDFLALLTAALQQRGLDYTAVSTVENFDGEVPIPPLNMDVRYTDRDVILARAGVAVSNEQHGNYSVGLPLPALFGGGIIKRGWTSVDAEVRGTSFRFVDTHPEAYGPDAVRMGEVFELIQGPLATTDPVILVGDLNTQPTTAVRGMLDAAGFSDAWTGPTPGFTCCQAGDLLNLPSSLDERIDYVLYRGEFHRTDMHVVGNHIGDRTPSGLWPSDHAGVIATLQQG